jgi:hypothetical protein
VTESQHPYDLILRSSELVNSVLPSVESFPVIIDVAMIAGSHSGSAPHRGDQPRSEFRPFLSVREFHEPFHALQFLGQLITFIACIAPWPTTSGAAFAWKS